MAPLSRIVALAALGSFACSFIAGPALAKPARCFTTDDGHYDCDFKGTDRQGSFEISAPGKPTYSLIVDAPGVAFGFINFGDRNISLPGEYRRQADDGACWGNSATNTKICAW